MDLMDRFRRWILEDARLGRLDEAACRDLLEAMYLIAHADGAVHAEEELRLRREALRLSWAWRRPVAELDREMSAASDRARAVLAEPEGLRWRVRDLAGRVLAADLREAAYRMLAGVAASDGLDGRESAILDEFRRALGLTHARAGEIEDGVHDELAGSLL